jgi:hypothetical protein
MRILITKRADPDGTLQRTDPREFERRYELEKKAWMAMMGAAHSAKAAEKRAAKAQRYGPLFVMTACPTCNAELGYAVPTGVKQELCVFHWFAAKAQQFGAVLDDAADAATREVAS